MSLNVYDRWQLEDGEVPVEVIRNTTKYFDENLRLLDTENVRDIMMSIDGAGYLNESTFQNNKPPVCSCDRRYLSSGCKAVLCLELCKDKCFMHTACGANAVYRMLRMTSGHMIYVGAQWMPEYGNSCDIVYRGRKFKNIKSFLYWRHDNGFEK